MKLSQLKNTIKELIKEQLGGMPAQLDPITPTYFAQIKCKQGFVPVEIHQAGTINNTQTAVGQLPSMTLTRPVGTNITFTCKRADVGGKAPNTPGIGG
tara:strand:+ start:257 stop:550 length:294 start_codon:yes stop_codon:yes gene_type:complete